MFTKWWNSIKLFVYFFLTDWRHTRRKNTTEITTIFYGFSQTDVLINFFIPLRRVEAITWGNFVPPKRDPSIQKRDLTLSGWNFLHVIGSYDLWRIHNTVGIPPKRDPGSVMKNTTIERCAIHSVCSRVITSSVLALRKIWLFWFR